MRRVQLHACCVIIFLQICWLPCQLLVYWRLANKLLPQALASCSINHYLQRRKSNPWILEAKGNQWTCVYSFLKMITTAHHIHSRHFVPHRVGGQKYKISFTGTNARLGHAPSGGSRENLFLASCGPWWLLSSHGLWLHPFSICLRGHTFSSAFLSEGICDCM